MKTYGGVEIWDRMYMKSRVMLEYDGQNHNKRMVDKVDENMTKKKYCGPTVTEANDCLYPRWN
jgi:hypothetical protein